MANAGEVNGQITQFKTDFGEYLATIVGHDNTTITNMQAMASNWRSCCTRRVRLPRPRPKTSESRECDVPIRHRRHRGMCNYGKV